jgi:hypothetical protein
MDSKPRLGYLVLLVMGLLIGLSHLGCGGRTTGEPDPFDLAAQQRYFPLRIGQVVDYQCDSVVYDFAVGGGIARDSSTTWVREVVSDSLRDLTGALVWSIERYERRSDTTEWQLARIWTASLTATQAIRTEENLRFLRLIFPMDRRSEWDGNRWIDSNREIEVAGERMRPFANWRYEVDSIDIAQRIGAFEFDSVLVVTEVDETNVIERRLSRSKYATGVGLVWREQWILDSQYCNQTPPPTDCETRPWLEKAERGYVLRQTVVAY